MNFLSSVIVLVLKKVQDKTFDSKEVAQRAELALAMRKKTF